MGKKSRAKALGDQKGVVAEKPKGPSFSSPLWGISASVVIFVVALVLRLVYVQQLSQSYFFAPFKGGFDDYIFDMWAREILRGNWLGDPAIYIYRMPLYVYFLAFVYFLFGHSYWAIYIIQAIIGSGVCVLTYYIGRTYFGRGTGFLAGLMAALYGPFLYYTGMVVGETLGIFLTCLGFLCLLGFQYRGRLWYLFCAGLCIGLSMLARGNMLIVLPFILGWLIIRYRKERLARLAASLVLLFAGIVIAVLPIFIRNYMQEKDIVPITALGGLNIYIGNAYGADGRYHTVEKVGSSAETMVTDSVRVAEEASGRKLKPSEVSNYWLKETIKSMHNNGVYYLIPLVIKKFILFWNAYELPDIGDYYFVRLHVPVLRLPLVTYAVIAVLFFVGAYLSWPRRGDLALLYVFVVGYMVSLVAVFITSRYRIQVVPFLSVPAAYALTRIGGVLRQGTKTIVTCGIILIAAAIFVNQPVERITFETSYNSVAVVLKRSGRLEEAIEMYKKAIEIAPAYPSPYYNLGILYRDTGRKALAVEHFKKSLEVDPDFRQAKERLRELGQ